MNQTDIQNLKPLIDAFEEWYQSDHHSENEDIYKREIRLDYLRALKPKEFIDFFFQFAHNGGYIQSVLTPYKLDRFFKRV